MSAIPPRVVANRRGISRGLATSNQAGSLRRCLEGTTCSRVSGTAVADELAMTSLQSWGVENDRTGSRGGGGPAAAESGKDGHQKTGHELMPHRQSRLRQAHAQRRYPEGDLSCHKPEGREQQRPLLPGPATGEKGNTNKHSDGEGRWRSKGAMPMQPLLPNCRSRV